MCIRGFEDLTGDQAIGPFSHGGQHRQGERRSLEWRDQFPEPIECPTDRFSQRWFVLQFSVTGDTDHQTPWNDRFELGVGFRFHCLTYGFGDRTFPDTNSRNSRAFTCKSS